MDLTITLLDIDSEYADKSIALDVLNIRTRSLLYIDFFDGELEEFHILFRPIYITGRLFVLTEKLLNKCFSMNTN